MNDDQESTQLTKPAAQSVTRTMQQIGELVAKVERGRDAPTREAARELTQSLLALHREALARIWSAVEASGEAGAAIRQLCLADPLLCQVLVLHDLHPLDLPARVAATLESLVPRLTDHGARVEMLDVADGVLRLRMVVGGCASAGRQLQQVVESALYEHAADLSAVVWDETPRPETLLERGFVPLAQLAMR